MSRLLQWGRNALGSLFRRQPDFRQKIRSAHGSIANKIWFLPYIDSVVGETAIMRAAYRQMMRDPTVKAALLSKLFSVASLDVSVNPASDSPGDVRAADFVSHCLTRVHGGLRGIAESILLPGLVEGYSLCEKVWALEDRSGPWKGKVICKDLKAKDPDTYTLEGDAYKNVTTILAGAYNAYEEFDVRDFVLYRHLSMYSNATGMPDLRAAYRAYWMIDTAWKLRSIFLEKWATPYLVGKYKDPGDENDLRLSLEEAKGQNFVTVPDTVMIEAVDLSVKGTADFRDAILDLQHEVMLGITGAFLQAMEGVKTGARSIGEVHQSTAELLIWHLAKSLSDILQEQLVPDLIDFNFVPGTGYPSLELGGINDADLLISTQVDEALQRMGLRLSEKDSYKRYRRSKPLDETDVLMPAMPAAPVPFMEPPAEPKEDKYRDFALKLLEGRLGGYNGHGSNATPAHKEEAQAKTYAELREKIARLEATVDRVRDMPAAPAVPPLVVSVPPAPPASMPRQIRIKRDDHGRMMGLEMGNEENGSRAIEGVSGASEERADPASVPGTG